VVALIAVATRLDRFNGTGKFTTWLGEPVVARIVGHMDVADGEQSVEHVVGASRVLLIDLTSCDTLLVDMQSQDPP
jgi:hypothetical protein